jgi:hypothetical protein
MEFELTQEVSGQLLENGKSNLVTKFSESLKLFWGKKLWNWNFINVYRSNMCTPEFDFFFKSESQNTNVGLS